MKKFRLLSRMMAERVSLLTDPADEAYYGLYERYWGEYVRRGGVEVCEREVAKWIAEHSGHPDFLHELDIKIAYAEISVWAHFPGAELSEFFHMADPNLIAISTQIGRLIYSNRDSFREYPNYVQQLLRNVDVWLRLSQEKNSQIDFGHAISAILPQRTPKSVAQSFKTGRINDDYPTQTNLSIIDEIKARLQPVRELIDKESAE